MLSQMRKESYTETLSYMGTKGEKQTGPDSSQNFPSFHSLLFSRKVENLVLGMSPTPVTSNFWYPLELKL